MLLKEDISIDGFRRFKFRSEINVITQAEIKSRNVQDLGAVQKPQFEAGVFQADCKIINWLEDRWHHSVLLVIAGCRYRGIKLLKLFLLI